MRSITENDETEDNKGKRNITGRRFADEKDLRVPTGIQLL